jgi:hypothetical protein
MRIRAILVVVLAGLAASLGGASVVYGQAVEPTLTVTVEGPGKGRVTSDPAGIACPGTCSASFPAGAAVRLTAAPAPRSHPFGGSSVEYYLGGWDGACAGDQPSCTVNLLGDAAVGATFVAVVGDPFFEIADAKVSVVRTRSARRILVRFRASLPGNGTVRLYRRGLSYLRTRVHVAKGPNTLVVALPKRFAAGRYELEVDLYGLNGAGHVAQVIRVPKR